MFISNKISQDHSLLFPILIYLKIKVKIDLKKALILFCRK